MSRVFLALALTSMTALVATPLFAEQAPPSGVAAGAASESADDSINAAVKKAVPYLWKEGKEWIDNRGCVSCHQVPAMVWSLSLAEERGFDMDAAQLKQWRQWSVKCSSFVRPDQREDLDVAKTLSSNIDTMNALMVADVLPDELRENWRSEFAEALVANQQDDGSWRACGQLPAQKRPKPETHQVTVMWTLIALNRQGADGYDAEAANQAIENSDPTSTEWYVTRLLLALETDDPSGETVASRLLELQNDDGGWGWLINDDSDALATGLALYALRRAGIENAATASATNYLVDTQTDDGHWTVPGTKQQAHGEPTATSNYWGTAWAVIGLLTQ